MKLVVKALFRSLGSLFKLLIVASIIIIVFGLIGVNLYQARFWHCEIGESQTLTYEVILSEIQTKSDCETHGGI